MKHYSITKTLVATLTAATFVSASVQPVRAQDEGSGEQVVGVVRLTPEVRTAITKGLDYLAKEGLQKADGSWGSGQNDVAETSAALMAFMLKGYIPGRGGRYGVVMENGLTYLINKGKAQRGFLGTPNNHAGMYEHGLAVLALSEAWGQSKNPQVGTALRAGVDIILRAQSSLGGWRYSPLPSDADLSMTVMQLVALNSAHESGIQVPTATIDKAVKYVKSCQDIEGSGGFKYMPGGGEVGFARSAAGVMSLIMTGQRNTKEAQKGLAFLKAYPDKKFEKGYPRFHYAHYYAVQAIYQSGEMDFQKWFPKIAATVVSMQAPDGSWSGEGGPAFATGMSILIIGVPYRFLPIYQR